MHVASHTMTIMGDSDCMHMLLSYVYSPECDRMSLMRGFHAKVLLR